MSLGRSLRPRGRRRLDEMEESVLVGIEGGQGHSNASARFGARVAAWTFGLSVVVLVGALLLA